MPTDVLAVSLFRNGGTEFLKMTLRSLSSVLLNLFRAFISSKETLLDHSSWLMVSLSSLTPKTKSMSLVNPFGFKNDGRLSNLSLLLLRLTFGGLMIINHGWGKMQKLLNEDPIKFADPIGLGAEFSLGLTVFAEVLCALMVVLGLFTRLAVIPLLVTMFVAIFVIHISDPFKKMEMAILYLIPYLILLWHGSGRFSLDALIGRE